MSPTRTPENIDEAAPATIDAHRGELQRRIDALGVRTNVERVLGKRTVDTAEDIQRLARSSNEGVRALFVTPLEHGDERFEVRHEQPRERPLETRATPPTGPQAAPPSAPPTTPAPPPWRIYKPWSWPMWKSKPVDAVAATTAAAVPVVFEGARNFILNIPLLGEALKGAGTLTEPIAKALQLPALQSGITSGITASVTTGAETLKGIYGLGWLGKTLAALNPAATAIAPYILPTALTGGGLYGLGKFSDWMHNLAGKKTEKAGLFKTMWRGIITPVTLPWLAVTKAPTLVKKGFNVAKSVTAPLFRHKIGTYGGAFLGYSVLAGLTGGMAIPWAIAGGLGGRFIQKRWFSGKAAAPKLEAAPEH